MTTIAPLAIGTKTPFGEVSAILCLRGERYYACEKNGVVSLMPACVIEVTAPPC